MKVRREILAPDFRIETLSVFNRLINDAFEVKVNRNSFRQAARIADAYNSWIRAGDALHLAIALEISAAVCTLDKKFAEAAARLGRPIILM